MIKTVEYTYEMECLDCGRIVKVREAQWKLKSFKRECVCKYDADIPGLCGWGMGGTIPDKYLAECKQYVMYKVTTIIEKVPELDWEIPKGEENE